MNAPPEDRTKADWQDHDAERYHERTGDYANRVDVATVATFIEGECGRALDLPCGTGRMTPLLRAKFETVSGDYSPTMLEFAARDSEFLGARLDAFSLGFADSTFDLVHSLRLSFHYTHFEEVLAEFHRVLKPGGVLVFDSLNRWTLRWLLSFPLNLARGAGSRRVYFRSRKEVAKLLVSAGFEIEQVEGRYLFPTRFYRHVPSFARGPLQSIERLLPSGVRVLSYWKARKRGFRN